MLRNRLFAAGVAAFLAATATIGIWVRPAKAVTAGMTVCASNTISASNSSSAITLSNCGPVVIIYNITSQEAFYNPGPIATTAAYNGAAGTGGLSIPGNTYVVIQINQAAPGQLSAITATSTTTLRIVQGWAQT